MFDLWIFAGLCLLAVAAVFVAGSKVRASRHVGIGGRDENLEQARRLYRAIFVWASVSLTAGACALMLGFRGAPVWRQTGEGQAVLNVLVVVGALAFLRSFVKTGYEQWSSKGSQLGLVRETVLGFVSGGLLMLAMVLRGG